jgi:hypothetical protein
MRESLLIFGDAILKESLWGDVRARRKEAGRAMSVNYRPPTPNALWLEIRPMITTRAILSPESQPLEPETRQRGDIRGLRTPVPARGAGRHAHLGRSCHTE